MPRPAAGRTIRRPKPFVFDEFLRNGRQGNVLHQELFKACCGMSVFANQYGPRVDSANSLRFEGAEDFVNGK